MNVISVFAACIARSLAIAVLVWLVAAGAADAQSGISLLETRAQGAAAVPAPAPSLAPFYPPGSPNRAARAPVAPPARGEDGVRLKLLAQVVAAELGKDEDAPLDTRVALAAAVLNHLDLARVPSPLRPEREDALDARAIYRMRLEYPRLLAQGYDGDFGVGSRDLAWLTAHGYAGSVDAAREALGGADPVQGATIWSDMFESSWEPLARGFEEVASYPSSGGRIAFYRKRS